LRELVGRFELGELGEGPAWALTQSNLKYFLSEYHSQAPITVALALSREVKPHDIESVTIHTYWFAWSEIGSEPEKWHPTTRESADHSLPFIIAAVLIDGRFSDAIFSEARLADPAVHALADRIAVKEDPGFTARFPGEIPCRIEIRTRAGALKTGSVNHPRGHVGNPMSDEEVAAKFKVLGSRLLGSGELDGVLECAWALDQAKSVRSLMQTLD